LLLLPAVSTGAALLHVAVGTITVAVLATALGLAPLFTLIQALAVPVVLLPLFLYGLAAAVLLSSLGVYVRDIGQVMPALSSLLMFLTPIFYPLSAVPASLRAGFAMNPIAWGAETLRALLLSGQWPPMASWGLHLAISVALLALCFFIFVRIQKGFADVL
jgi:lipopolysaccharide transport system permease protein